MGRELYGTNGTAVSLVADANVGAASSYPYPVAVVNGKALVWLDNATVGTEVWASDGTTAGTMLLADITPGAGGSSGESLAVIGNQALLSIWSSGTYALWLSDGTPTGTTSLISFPQGTRPLDSIGEVGGRHCFGLLEPEHGAEVWCTDGTVTGTVLLRDLCVGTCNALGVSG
jgi:ELWxxDGT repeat protein